MDDENKSRVCRLKCDNCNAENIGEMKRKLKVPKKEHLSDCTKPHCIGFSLHSIPSQNER
jgi:hypothetical protein